MTDGNDIEFSQELKQFAHLTSKEFGGGVDKDSILVAYFLLQTQLNGGIRGDLAEIGVKQGKYLSLLAAGMNAGECVFGVDPYFDLPQIKDHAERFIKELLGDIDIRMMIQDSRDLNAQDLRRDETPGIRIFHIDGNHHEDFVYNDLAIADKCLVDAGVIVLDDYFHFSGVGVSSALFRYLIQENHNNLAPVFAIGPKFYLCRPGYVKAYQDCFMQYFDRPDRPIFNAHWLGRSVISCSLTQLSPTALRKREES